jgi:hypothetical protein
MRIALLWLSMFGVLLALAPAVKGQPAASIDLEVIEQHMQVLLLQALLDPECPTLSANTDITVIDASIMYQYSPSKGLRPIRLLDPSIDGVLVPGEDGITTLATVTQGMSLETPLFPVPGPPYLPMRQILSLDGYRKAEGTVAVPSANNLTGIDRAEGFDEGAFNYFGIQTSEAPLVDVEMGISSQCTIKFGDDNKRWYAYHSINSKPWSRDPWPAGGIPPGTQVYMKAWVPADNQFSAYWSANNLSLYTSTYGAYGLRYDASHRQFVRRTTSMVLYGAGTSIGNVWSGIQIATPQNQHYWVPGDSHAPITTGGVSVTETNPYYNETVSIRNQ